MKKKNFVSLSMAAAFLALSITGILIYVKLSPGVVKHTHTVFGLIFVGFAIFHILNNWDSLVAYTKERKSGKIQKEFWLPASVFIVVLALGLTGFLEPIAEAGRFFAGKRPPRAGKLEYDVVSTNKDVKGTNLSVMIQKNKEAELPEIAVWVEDSSHKFVENLFVPAKVAAIPEDKEEAEEGHFDIVDFKPETLSAWQAKASSKTPNYERETPHENFILKTNSFAKSPFFIELEIKSNNKIEVYEAAIDASKGEVFKLKSRDNSLIMSGLVEIK